MKLIKLVTRQEGKNGKNFWPEIGTLFIKDDGKITGFLNNAPNVQVFGFEKQPQQQQPAQQYNQPPGNVQFAKETFEGSEEVPF